MLTPKRPAWGLLLALLAACGAEAENESGSNVVDSSRWAAWPMPNSKGLGLPNEQSYEVTGAGEEEVVHDLVTGLDWQRTLATASFSSSAAAVHCDALDYAGYTDWRLPTRLELVSLLDLSRTDPALSLSAFPSGPSEWYWSSTPDSADPTRTWYVYFYFGYPDVDDGANENRARCVRSEASLSRASKHYDVQAQWVRDLNTGLLWQRQISEQSFDATSAAEYCAALAIGQESGFRLPTMKELETLVDERRFRPAIDVESFPDAPSEHFWSSSAWSGTTNLAWYVRFDTGSALYDLASEPMRVRCVR
jgi:hypothetical protein